MPTSLSSLFYFKSIGIQIWKCLTFDIFRKKNLQKMQKSVKK